MTDSGQRVDALLTEHFRYTPLSLIDDVINTVNTIIYRAIEAIENGLYSIPPHQLGYRPEKPPSEKAPSNGADYAVEGRPEASEEIDVGMHQLETLLEATVDRTFDKFEIYTLRNILTVPDTLAPWMRLAHYEGLTLPLPPSYSTPESILALRRQVQETKKLNLALRHTFAQNAATITQLRSILGSASRAEEISPESLSLGFLAPDPSVTSLNLSFKPPPEGANGPLESQTRFFMSQLPALRARLEELRPKVDKLQQKIGDVDWDSKREERRRYIENRVKKVARSRSGGEMKGVRMSVEEVRDLEAVGRTMGAGDRMEE